MRKNMRKILALSMATSMALSSVGIQAFAEESKTTETVQDGGLTTEITTTTATDSNATSIKVTVTVETETKNQDGEVVKTSSSEEGTEVKTEEITNPTDEVEVPLVGDGVEPDKVDENGNPVFVGTNEDVLPEPEITDDEPQGEDDDEYDYTIKEETPREVEVTITDSSVVYDDNADAHEGEQDLNFKQVVWDGTQKNLGGGTLDWFPGNSLDKTVDGYIYTPYGFMHNDVTHMYYIRTDKDGGMVDIDGNEVYYYDEETGTYLRTIPDEVVLYDVIAQNVKPLYYKSTSDDGSENFTLIDGNDEAGVAKIESVVFQANSMMSVFYDRTQTYTEETWDAVSDRLNAIGELQKKSSSKKAEYDAYVAERKAYDSDKYTPAKNENYAAWKEWDAAKKVLKAAKTEEEKAAAQLAVNAAQAKYAEKNAIFKEYEAVRKQIIANYSAADAEKKIFDSEISAIMSSLKKTNPELIDVIDISRLAADYDDDGKVSEETKNIYNALFALLESTKAANQFKSAENMIPAYCVDVNTGTVRGSWYDLVNVEDAGYYSTERNEANGFISDADRIKAIALNGYWGTKDAYSYVDEATGKTVEVPAEKGSLTAFKAFFQERLDEATAKGETLCYTQEDIDGLTHGCALSITQHSLWRFGNSLDGAIMDAYTYQYNDRPERNARVEKFIEYFTTMPIDTEEFDESEIFTQEKFIGEMTLTVGNKAENHENNSDDDKENDAYNAELNFSLVVTPGEGDDLVVSVVSGDKVIAKARIAGDGTNDDETFTGNIISDGNGNYTFTGLTLVENSNQTFSLNLEGAQYLEEGVYLFKSAGGPEASQTYATIAEGSKSVDLKMEIDLTFNVEEGSVKETRKWKKKTEWEKEDNGDSNNKPDSENNNSDMGNDSDNDHDPEPEVTIEVPTRVLGANDEKEPEADFGVLGAFDTVEIVDDMIPLAVLPATGDLSPIWIMLCILSAFGIAGTSFIERKKRSDEQ